MEYRQYSLLTLHILSWASKNINNNYLLNFNDYWVELSFIILLLFFFQSDSTRFHWQWLVQVRLTWGESSALSHLIIQPDGLISLTHRGSPGGGGGGWGGTRGRRRRRKGEPPHAASWHSRGWWENVHLAEIIKHERCNYINLHIATNGGGGR